MVLKFIEKRKEASDAFSFLFKPDKKFSFKPGQYLFYTLPCKNPDNRGITRYFTISCAPFKKYVSITTRISNISSTFKKSLMKLKKGDKIEASGPDGDFIVEDPNKNCIFIAGGIGITPFRSILLDLYHRKLPINVQLLYANKDEDIVFKEQLESLKSKNPNFNIEYFISPARIDEKIVNLQLSIVNNSLIYISGPSSFVREIRDIVKAQGVTKENIKLDFFSDY